jgi:hypothetical protein
VVAVGGFIAAWFHAQLVAPQRSSPWALVLTGFVALPPVISAGLLCFRRTREAGLAIAATWGGLVLLVGVPGAYLHAAGLGRQFQEILTVAIAHGFWAALATMHVPRGALAWAAAVAAAVPYAAVYGHWVHRWQAIHYQWRVGQEARALAEVEQQKADAERRRLQDIEATIGRCQGGSTDDCVGAARALLNEAARDGARAAVLFQTACERRAWIGCTELAEMYRLGVDIPRDLAHAKEWGARPAASVTDPPAPGWAGKSNRPICARRSGSGRKVAPTPTPDPAWRRSGRSRKARRHCPPIRCARRLSAGAPASWARGASAPTRARAARPRSSGRRHRRRVGTSEP